MSERFHKKILQHVGDRRYQPSDCRRLATDLGVSDEEYDDFRRAIDQLVVNNQVVIGSSDVIGLPPPGREMTGVIRMNQRGFGFLVPDMPTAHGDLFVPAGATAGAMTGDRVRAKVIHEKGRAGDGRSPFVGRVVEIIQRAERRYVGTLTKRGGEWLVAVDGKALADPVIVRDPQAKNARAGDKVVVELLEYPSDEGPAEGVITEVLGEAGEPDVETRAVMAAYGLNERFPAQVTEDARAAAARFDPHAVSADREDLTGEFIITIDPPDAKDYDDAISIRWLGEGEPPIREGQGPGAEGQGDGETGDRGQGTGDSADHSKSEIRHPKSHGPRPSALGPSSSAVWELGVHIADVSHFVSLGTELDREAYKRGNSTYLPRKVVPMLPELLSNGVCSLQEGVHRNTLSAFMQYDAQGNVVGQRFSRSVIHSAKRLTYIEAQALINDDLREARRHAKTEPKYPSKLTHALKLMDALSKVIRKRRFKQGMIVLGLPEVELVYDDSGRVVDATPEDNAYTHTLIEMFMVEANEAVARLFNSLDVPMIRRIHPDPPSHDMTALRSFARVAGFNIPANPTRKELQTLLEAVRGKPAQQAVHFAVLRTLSKAEYSPLLIGHFALASEHYSHFTSPIRRYPDLIVHRALGAYLDLHPDHRKHTIPTGKGRGRLSDAMQNDPRCPDVKKLTEMGQHCSATERNSEAAEDDLRTYLVLELLSQHLGDDFEGTVTGVASSGIFIQLDKFLTDGFIAIADVSRSFGTPGDRYNYNRMTGSLVAMRSGKTIAIGDRFIVRIAKVDVSRRSLDLVIVSSLKSDGQVAPPGGDRVHSKEKRKQGKGARAAHQEAMKLKRQKQGWKSSDRKGKWRKR